MAMEGTQDLPPRLSRERLWVWAALWLMPALVFVVVLWPAFQAYFTIDDFAWLQLRQIHLEGQPFLQLIFKPAEHGTWRPISERLTFYVFAWLWPGSVLPFRILMFATQIGSMCLLAAVMFRLTRSRVAAAAAPLFWVVNMNLAPAVAWNSSYMEVLCGFCLLLAFHQLLGYVETGRRANLVAMWLVFLFNFGVMETNLVFPALTGAYALLYSRKHLRTVAPMAVVSVVFVILHLCLAPRAVAGTYSVHFSPVAVAKAVWQYTRWAFKPASIDVMIQGRWYVSYAWAIAALGALLAFVAWRAWKRDGLPALFLFWYLALLAPVAPLTEHLTPYYLTLPLMGLGMLAGWALASAWRVEMNRRARVVFGAAALVLVLGWVWSMPRATYRTARWFREYSYHARDFVQGVRTARAQTGPAKTLVVTGFDPQAYEICLHHGCTKAMGLNYVWVAPDWAPWIIPRPEAGADPRWFADDATVRRGLESGSLAVFSIHDRTSTDLSSKVLAEMNSGTYTPPSRINLGDPANTRWLSGDWYAPEKGFRWMGRKARVVLAGPDGAARKLAIHTYCVDSPERPNNVALRIAVDGVAATAYGIKDCHGPLVVRLDPPPYAVGFPRAVVDLELSLTYRVSGDSRELGLPVSIVGWE
jgi:hypothetical protein